MEKGDIISAHVSLPVLEGVFVQIYSGVWYFTILCQDQDVADYVIACEKKGEPIPQEYFDTNKVMGWRQTKEQKPLDIHTLLWYFRNTKTEIIQNWGKE